MPVERWKTIHYDERGSSKIFYHQLVCSLITVAWPAAARSGAPNHSAGGPQGRLAAPRKKKSRAILALNRTSSISS